MAAFNKESRDQDYKEFIRINTSDLGLKYPIKSLSFPTISTGIFRCTTKDTVNSVVSAVYELLKTDSSLDIKQINFVFWDPNNQQKAQDDYNLYKAAFLKKIDA